ncbi:MAG TPA: hypothetical protein VFE08_14430 [Candidatus Sulfotelmatobacter sp.]|jgi:hypothetical protein|nr:hypothetical protein [Candidatus Sulfotelmatobacter sp.]
MEYPLRRRYRPSPPPAPLPTDPTVTDEDQASFAYFLSDPACDSFKLTL